MIFQYFNAEYHLTCGHPWSNLLTISASCPAWKTLASYIGQRPQPQDLALSANTYTIPDARHLSILHCSSFWIRTTQVVLPSRSLRKMSLPPKQQSSTSKWSKWSPIEKKSTDRHWSHWKSKLDMISCIVVAPCHLLEYHLISTFKWFNSLWTLANEWRLTSSLIPLSPRHGTLKFNWKGFPTPSSSMSLGR